MLFITGTASSFESLFKILSDLAIHTPKACEIELSWETIFQRIVVENRPGVCYERGEVLYQTLAHLGRIYYFLNIFCVFIRYLY